MSTHTPGPLRVMSEYRGKIMQIGTVNFDGVGYRFMPMYQRKISRKSWPTPQDALRGRVKNYTLEPI